MIQEKSNTSRKPLSKKIRFEIFKRDKFQCQYCGGNAPEVVLHVDHIDPVAEGGSNDILNLITSCASCNLGKGKRRLNDNSTLAKQRKQIEDLQDRREQTEMMMEWRKGLNEQRHDEVDQLSDYWSDLAPGFICSGHENNQIRK